MDERVYGFLLSIAAVPACEADDDDDGPPTSLQIACQALGTAYVECHGGNEASFDSYCRQVAAEIESYGPACSDAYEEWFACLAEVECPILSDSVPATCMPVYSTAHAMCPELFSLCAFTKSGGGPAGCEATASGCLDGKEYAMQCDLTGDTYQCTCTANGVLTARFNDDDPCRLDTLGEVAATHCGFPEGVRL